MDNIILFLKNLKSHNDRAWFAEHKSEYEIAKKDFERIGSELILKIASFDEEIGRVDIRNCIFRIYRDIRFSPDKTPYKNHFGAFIAYPNGRKSPRAGYYLHIEPDENSFFSAGVWSPKPRELNALRRSVYENYDEFEEIINKRTFSEVFGKSFYQEDKLKRLPAGFSKDFKDPEMLKLKHYLVSADLSLEQISGGNLVDIAAKLAYAAYPFVKFMNYALDEIV